MSKNVAVFVDVANIFYAAKAAGVDIDYVTLLKASSAGRDLVRAYAYTGLDPENENQRNFHDFLRRHGYKVVSKDIRKYGDGKVKANLDIELVVDMMKTARNLDIAIVVSGDGDFAPAIRAVQEMGVRVEVVSFRGNTSSDLIEVADIFTDITQIAKVEKGSGRSGRRVADDDEDLSMTEVPDKMTEGSGDRRRGRGGRSRAGEGTGRGSRRTTSRSTEREEAPAAEGNGELVALPGEKLSRVARKPAAPPAEVVAPDEELEPEISDEEAAEGAVAAEGNGTGDEGGQRRRRRRRGGRGRGRGRGRAEGAEGAPATGEPGEEDGFEEGQELEALPQAPRKAAFSFGSVWDSQLGVPSTTAGSPARGPAGELDEEDLEEPAIPEYLLAERRQRDRGRSGGRGARGGRGSAYAAAMERERFGGGRGAPPSRFAEPAPRRDSRGGGQPGRSGGRGYDRPERSEPRGAGGDPWSEVPPEIEAMLRAQLAGSGGRGPRPEPARTPAGDAPSTAATQAARTAAPEAATEAAPARGRRSSTRARAGAKAGAATTEPVASSEAASGGEAAAPVRRRSTASRASKAAAAEASGGEPAGEPIAKPSRRRASAPKAGPVDASDAAAGAAATDAPKRRATRKKADTPA